MIHTKSLVRLSQCWNGHWISHYLGAHYLVSRDSAPTDALTHQPIKCSRFTSSCIEPESSACTSLSCCCLWLCVGWGLKEKWRNRNWTYLPLWIGPWFSLNFSLNYWKCRKDEGQVGQLRCLCPKLVTWHLGNIPIWKQQVDLLLPQYDTTKMEHNNYVQSHQFFTVLCRGAVQVLASP